MERKISGSDEYVSLSNLPLDTNIPTSGEIKFSDFYGKQLNMIVDYFDDTGSSGGEANNVLNRQDDGANTMAATWRYNNQSSRVKVVGGFRSRPTGTVSGYSLSSTSWQGGKKVFINVNKQLGSAKAASNSDRNKVALRTGNWPSGTTLQIDIGSSGRIQGAGGNGRQGNTNSGTPSQAFTGTSGLGIDTNNVTVNVASGGIIRAGFGGGGGGGGGQGIPGGAGGTSPEGRNGTAGSATAAGDGGGGGSRTSRGEATINGGDGGEGGHTGDTSADDGESASLSGGEHENPSTNGGGSGGGGGGFTFFSLVFSSSSIK